MIFQKKKVTRSLSLLHHRATYGGESKQTDPSLQPHETVYKLLTDRGKKEVARPNQPTVSSPGGRRKTNTRRPRKSSRDRRPEEKGTCSFAAKSLQASRTTSRRKESRRGLVAVCVYIYARCFDSWRRQFRPRRGDNSIPTNPERISPGVPVITLHKSWRGVEPMRTVPLQTAAFFPPPSPRFNSSPLRTFSPVTRIWRTGPWLIADL